jgi:hypothetical protein
MLHILCKRCKCWIPRQHGKYAYSFGPFKTKTDTEGIKQIRCLCGRWTHDTRVIKILGTAEQIKEIKNAKNKTNL